MEEPEIRAPDSDGYNGGCIAALAMRELFLGEQLKKSVALMVCAATLVASLSGCTQIQSAYEQATGTGYSDKLTADGKVETPTGAYTSIRVSDKYLNSVYGGVTGDGLPAIPNKDDSSQMMQYNISGTRGFVTRYFFNDWIDSIALEGGADEFNTWKSQGFETGKLLSAPYTTAWLNGEKGSQGVQGVLGKGNLFGKSSASLIHDGRPRISDADIKFGDAQWAETEDGVFVLVASEWSVNYRVSEDVAREVAKTNVNTTDVQWAEFLKEEPKYGKGETLVRVEGTATWWVKEGSGNASESSSIYFVEAKSKPQLVR